MSEDSVEKTRTQSLLMPPDDESTAPSSLATFTTPRENFEEIETPRENSNRMDSMEPPVSLNRMTINLVLCGLGAGILSLPWTTAGAGVLNAGFWICTVLGISYKTMIVLVQAAEKEQLFDLETLAEKCELRIGRFIIRGAQCRIFCQFGVWFSYWLALMG